MHGVANLATLQTPSAIFFSQKKKRPKVLFSSYVVLMGCVSITLSYSFHCLTTETIKYINENGFIENLAASKYSMWAQRGKHNRGYVHFACSEEVSCLVSQKCKQVCVSKLLSAKEDK